MDAKISFQPHPLMPLIVNLRLRLEVCFEKLVAFSGTAEAREIAFGLLDILVSSEPDDLQVVPEWTRGEVNKVEMFIEQCRYAAKSKPYELTPAEKACIRAAQVGTAEHRGRLKEAWANCLRNLDRQKPLPRASVPQAPEHHDEKAPSSTSTGPLAPSAEKSVVSPAQATQGPSSPVMPRERCEHSEDYCSVIWFGTRYEFTKTQAACIKCLWAEWEKGGLALAEETIGEKAGSASESFRLFHTFRMKAKSKMTKRVGKTNVHIVWGTMIVPAGKGKFRLEAPKKRQITR